MAEASGSSGATPAVDRTVLQSLAARLGDRAPAMLDRLLDTWSAEMDKRLGQVDAAVAGGDAEDLARAAHAMKGGSASLGALHLASVCADVEDRLRAGEPVDLETARRRIADAVREARQALDQLRDGSSG